MTYSVVAKNRNCGHHHQSVPTAEHCADKLSVTPKWKDVTLAIKGNTTGRIQMRGASVATPASRPS